MRIKMLKSVKVLRISIQIMIAYTSSVRDSAVVRLVISALGVCILHRIHSWKLLPIQNKRLNWLIKLALCTRKDSINSVFHQTSTHFIQKCLRWDYKSVQQIKIFCILQRKNLMNEWRLSVKSWYLGYWNNFIFYHKI